MLRHTVLLRIDAADAAVRSERSQRLIAALESLPPHIPQIRALAVNANVIEREGNWDLALVVDVDDADALEVYRSHPEHQKVLTLISEVTSNRCAVDFPV